MNERLDQILALWPNAENIEFSADWYVAEFDVAPHVQGYGKHHWVTFPYGRLASLGYCQRGKSQPKKSKSNSQL